MAFQPGDREKRLAAEALYPGMPSHLAPAIRQWIQSWLESRPQVLQAVCIDMRLNVVADPTVGYHQQELVLGQLRDVGRHRPEFMLNIIESMIAVDPAIFFQPAGGGVSHSAHLDDLLSRGNSLYEIRNENLVERVSPEAREQLEEAIAAASRTAADHLVAAWRDAYQREPNADQAIEDAIKAVEAAAQPVLAPKDSSATLTKMAGDLKIAAHLWDHAMFDKTDQTRPITRTIEMMRLLHDTQTGRHGVGAGYPDQSIESVRAALQLAATLVQWFSTGVIFKK